MKKIKTFLLSLLSRKFLLALAGAYMAWEASWSDQVVTQAEIGLILTPLLSFIGIEGVGDIKERNEGEMAK